MIKIFLIGLLVWSMQGCSSSNPVVSSLEKEGYRQELSRAKDWKSVYYINGGIYALKQNGILWMFREMRKDGMGLIAIDPDAKRVAHYDLKGKELNLFSDKATISQMSVGHNRIYVITDYGILLALGREIRKDSYFGYFTYIDAIGEFREWESVVTTGSSELGECTEHTLGFTKDGMLYGISDKSDEYFEYIQGYFPKPLGTKWKQVLMGCYTDYAMKKDGTYWKWGVEYGAPEKVIDKVLIEKIATKMKEIKEALVSYDIDMQIEDAVKPHKGVLNDGSLWLLPKIEYK
jgi:hypothetical protein